MADRYLGSSQGLPETRPEQDEGHFFPTCLEGSRNILYVVDFIVYAYLKLGLDGKTRQLKDVS